MAAIKRVLSRKELKDMATQTLKYIIAGYYIFKDQKYMFPTPETYVYLQSDFASMFSKQLSGDYIPLNNRFVLTYTSIDTGNLECEYSIQQATTLEAAQYLRLQHPDERIAILNFASANNPGGGFINGAQAQEESIARASSLYASLEQAKDYYTLHSQIRKYYTIKK